MKYEIKWANTFRNKAINNSDLIESTTTVFLAFNYLKSLTSSVVVGWSQYNHVTCPPPLPGP